MLLSKLKSIIESVYYQIIFLLPVKLANRLLYVDPDRNWSISIYAGDSLLELQPLPNIKNPAISRLDINDVCTGFVADPFMVKFQDNWLMFFEIFNQKRQLGELAFASSKNGLNWDYQQVILAEPFHLSYPYVFESGSNWYMIPETCEVGAVRLYQAKNFPQTWELVSELIVGERFVDASVIEIDSVWWMFVGVEKDRRTPCDTLRLYYADRLDGDWIEHPMSPIISNNREISRPAGRMIQIDGKPIRFTQDCTVYYGRNVSAIQIDLLTKNNYAESKINPDGTYLFSLGTLSYNGVGIHHLDLVMLDQNRYLACVDAKG